MYVDMESIEEMMKLLEATNDYEEVDGKEVEIKPLVFIGQLNEKLNEQGLLKINIIVCSSNMSNPESNDIIRYTEFITIAQIPNESLKDNKETELLYQRLKKDYDMAESNISKRKSELIKMFTDKGYYVFKGVLL